MTADSTQSTASLTTFQRLAATDCSEHVERKGKFSYLSWAWAVRMLREADECATWTIQRFEGAPYLKTDCGYFVEVAVTVNGMTLSQIHPILNAQNKPIAEPNAFDVNTSIQRCLVKAIALHGLGLYIYAGEDLPNAIAAETLSEDPATAATLEASETIDELRAAWKAIPAAERDRYTETKNAVRARIEHNELATRA